jgi:transposase-like protein
MITVTLLCPYCESENLVRNGHAVNGKQRYFFQECRRYSRENPASRGYSEERKEEILRAYQECSSLRGIEWTFGVFRYTVAEWLKKSR